MAEPIDDEECWVARYGIPEPEGGGISYKDVLDIRVGDLQLAIAMVVRKLQAK